MLTSLDQEKVQIQNSKHSFYKCISLSHHCEVEKSLIQPLYFEDHLYLQNIKINHKSFTEELREVFSTY
jgi:hypothetical protein